jgi:epsilon-lactone hydrolase
MASIQARLFAGVLRVFYKPGWYNAWSGENVPRDRGGGLDAANRRAHHGYRVKTAYAAGVPCVWIEPQLASAPTTIFYLHGGAYTSGTLLNYLDMLGWMAREYGLRSLYADYRLAPRHLFPAAVDDSLAAYRWLLASGVAPSRIVFAGDSAGGGLALATMLAARDAGVPLPAAAVLLSPWTDLEGTGETLATRERADPMLKPPTVKPSGHSYLGSADPRNPLASPLFANPVGLPPLLIHVGDAEILLDDSRVFAERARAAGVDVTLRVWPELFHVFPIFPSLLPEARKADAEMAAFVLAHTH